MLKLFKKLDFAKHMLCHYGIFKWLGELFHSHSAVRDSVFGGTKINEFLINRGSNCDEVEPTIVLPDQS